MYQLNYFKNGALILVVVMLITIPNLNVYSSIGSYQIVSSAITANKKHMLLEAKDNHNSVLEDIASLSGIAALPCEVMALVMEDHARAWNRGVYYPKKHNTKPYAKYDFSGFDN